MTDADAAERMNALLANVEADSAPLNRLLSNMAERAEGSR